MQVELNQQELDTILSALEYYRTDVCEFGIRHGETPSEVAEAEVEVKATEELIKRLGLYSIVGQPT